MFDGILQLLKHGASGYLMILTGVACIIIGIERIFFLFVKMSYKIDSALEKIREDIVKKKYSEALQMCQKAEKSPEIKVIKNGLLAAEGGREAMKSALTSEVLKISRMCEERLSYLSLIASSATLIGLFGTILGLIKTFSAIGGKDAIEKGRLLGEGISEAMYSTAAGVIVGVAAMVLHTICVSKADHITSKVQNAALNFVNWIEQSERVRE